MEPTTKPTLPIINCHTHIFTGDHVPPWLAKTYLFSPLYYLLHLSLIVKAFRWWNEGPARTKYRNGYKKLMGVRNRLQVFTDRFRILKFFIAWFLTIQVLFILFDWVSALFPPDESKLLRWFGAAREWLAAHYILLPITNTGLQISLVLFVLLFVRWGRNFIFFLFKKFWSFFGAMPGPQTKEMLRRYLNIGRYAFHTQQIRILGKLRRQYPEGSGFVILPMDMEYMEMGKVKKGYRAQMEELAGLKKNHEKIIFPFVFADPRRLVTEPDYFRYEVKDSDVVLQDCFVKQYIEEKHFSGFKIYPALGYYPFDVALLPLYKYAADNGLPVLTHCIKGTIFFRGKKKEDWNRHQVFEQTIGKERVNFSCYSLTLVFLIDFVSNLNSLIFIGLALKATCSNQFPINFRNNKKTAPTSIAFKGFKNLV